MLDISVIIPVYNVAPYLCQCIDSVLNQTLKNIEIICIDDGSTDESLKILEKYETRYDNIRIYKQKNKGSGLARNNGIKHAKGRYVTFMDSDDWYPSRNVLCALYNAVTTNDVYIAGGSIEEYDANYEKYIADFKDYEEQYKNRSNYFIRYKDMQFMLCFFRYIYNRDFLITNNIYFPNYSRGQDALFCVNALSKADSIYLIKDTVYCYQINHRTINWTDKKYSDYVNCITNILDKAVECQYHLLYKQALRTLINFILGFKKYKNIVYLFNKLDLKLLHTNNNNILVKCLWIIIKKIHCRQVKKAT